MLPPFTANGNFAKGLDRAHHHGAARLMRWAVRHYAVDTNRFPESAAADAAACVAARVANPAELCSWGGCTLAGGEAGVI